VERTKCPPEVTPGQPEGYWDQPRARATSFYFVIWPDRWHMVVA
jgi:hypothetical protein